MNRFDVRIKRTRSFPNSLLGELFVGGQSSRLCYTLELPWLWNQSNVSCVPPGVYNAFVRSDKTDGWRLQLTGVPGGRSGIQIHIGNFPRQIEGCVLVGMYPGFDSVTDSATAYRALKSAFDRGAPYERIRVSFTGLLATPWGDYAHPWVPVA